MGRTKQSSSWYSRRRSSSAPATPREVADPPIGCMSMVHYLIFAPGAGCVGRPPATSSARAHVAVVAPQSTNYDHQHDAAANGHHRQRDTGGKGGTEAPRNSLDLDADGLGDIQIGVQVEPVFDALARTSMRRARATAPSSEAETPRTPSLVARLMGIDGLPDQSSPSPALSKHRASTGSTQKPAPRKESNCSSAPASAGKEKKKRVIPESMNRREPLRSLSCNVPAGDARSLPDTPRGSTSARASWDGPRLSLQALKENVLDRAALYMSLPSSPTSSAAAKKKKHKDAHGRRARNDEERERTAKEHAREIVRQAKETVAKRKSKSNTAAKSSPVAAQKQSTSNKENERPPATSPVMENSKFMAPVVVVQPGGKPAVAPPPKAQGTEHPPPSHVHRVPLAPKHPPPPPPPQRAKPSRPPPPPPPLDPPTGARKPDGCERFATRIKTKPAAGFQAPAAAATPSAPASSSGRAPSPPSPSRVVPLEEDPEYGYLRTVLERGGFMRAPASRGRPFKGHSVSAPVDPIVFHLLELELPADETRLGPLRHRWNRKLLFHLTQEILADFLLGLDTSSSSGAAPPCGAPLLGRLWKKVRSFPAADCRVVGDIDALVATDLEAASVRRLGRHPAVCEEAGDVAEEVAERVLEGLLGECVTESLSLSSSSSSSHGFSWSWSSSSSSSRAAGRS